MRGAARLRFAALRAGMEFFDHAAKSAIERRNVVWMRLLSDLISVMIHCDAAVGANHWVGFSHFNNLNEAERSSGRIAATPTHIKSLGNSSTRPRICRIVDLTILIEEIGNLREIAVPESANQTKLAEDQQQTLQDARAAKTAGGNIRPWRAVRRTMGIKSGPNCAVG